VRRLLIFGRFAHDAKRVLATVYRLALVGIKLGLNAGVFELGITPFADSKPLFHDPQFALRHDLSLAHSAGRIDLWISNGTTT